MGVQTVHQLFIDTKRVNDSVGREVLYNILIEFGVPMKRVRIIKMSLSEIYNKICVWNLVSDIKGGT
jgi:hypothetical protein